MNVEKLYPGHLADTRHWDENGHSMGENSWGVRWLLGLCRRAGGVGASNPYGFCSRPSYSTSFLFHTADVKTKKLI